VINLKYPTTLPLPTSFKSTFLVKIILLYICNMKKFFVTRLSRKKYFLYFVLPYLILFILFFPILREEFALLLASSKGGGVLIGGSWVAWIVRGCLILFCAGSIRRLHDLGRSGWWSLLIFMSMIFFPLFPLVLLYLIFKEGEKETNKWGDSN